MYLKELSIEIPPALLKEAIKLNYNLIKMPFNNYTPKKTDRKHQEKIYYSENL